MILIVFPIVKVWIKMITWKLLGEDPPISTTLFTI